MYSPKIKEEFIPLIYRIAKSRGTRMTVLINDIVNKALKEMEELANEPASTYQKRKEKRIHKAGRNGQGTGKTEAHETGQDGSLRFYKGGAGE